MQALAQTKNGLTNQNLHLQNGLSLLRSAAVETRESGRYGLVYDRKTQCDEYVFIPDGKVEITVKGTLTEAEALDLKSANAQASEAFVIAQLSRLSLHKRMRVGESTAHAFFSDLASDIAGVGELAVVEACARLRRDENPFYPTSAEIIKAVCQVTAEIEKVITTSRTASKESA